MMVTSYTSAGYQWKLESNAASISAQIKLKPSILMDEGFNFSQRTVAGELRLILIGDQKITGHIQNNAQFNLGPCA
jgi:hypothetical protein